MDRLRVALLEQCRQVQNKKLLLAVSGGVDSMALLDGMCAVQDQCNIELFVAHFEHGIRGEESQADAAFVEQAAKQRGLPFFVKSENIPLLAGNQNLERMARQRRYAFFRELLASEHLDYIVTAHHADDNAETVLMNFIRGCGLSGLSGMHQFQGAVFRPMLELTKAEIQEYVRMHQLAFREDSTNADNTMTRNFIRNELVPKIEELNPNFIASMNKMSALLSEDEDYLRATAKATGYAAERPYGYEIDLATMQLHPALRNRLVYDCLQSLLGRDISFRMIGDVLGLMTLENGKRKQIAGELWAYRNRDSVSLVETKPKVEGEFLLQPQGKTETPFGTFVVEQVESRGETTETTCFFSGEGQLLVRARQEGDRMVPFGHRSLKKLKSMMNDKKVPIFLRESMPLIFLNHEILFVPYVGRSNVALADDKNMRKISYFPQ